MKKWYFVFLISLLMGLIACNSDCESATVTAPADSFPAESEVNDTDESKETMTEAIEGMTELMEAVAENPAFLFYYDAVEADNSICSDTRGWDKEPIGSVWNNFSVPIEISNEGIEYYHNDVFIAKEYPVSLWYSDRFDQWWQIDFCYKNKEVVYNLTKQ